MAMKIDLLAEMKVMLKKGIGDKIKTAVKGAGGNETDTSEKKDEKKQESLLTLILTRLGPLAILMSIEPVMQLIKILLGLIVFYTIKGLKLMWESLKWVGGLLKSYLKKVWEEIKFLMSIVWSALKWLWKVIKPILTFVWEAIKNGLKFVWETLKWLWDVMKPVLSAVWEALKAGYNWLASILEKGWSYIKDGYNLMVPILSDMYNYLKEVLVSVWDSIVEFATESYTWFTDIVKWLTDTYNKIVNLPLEIWNYIKQLGKMIADLMPSWPSFGGNEDKNGEEVTDAIITKSGKVIKTHPDDTIIATKGGLPGSGGNTFNFYGVTQSEFLQQAKRELGIDVFKTNRF